MKKINIVLMICMFLVLYSGTSFAQQINKKSKLITFNSRTSLAKKFGNNIANQVPGYFNFRKYKLIAFKPKSIKGKKTVKLVEPKTGHFYDQPFTWGTVRIEKANRTAVISVLYNAYKCTSPIASKPSEARKKKDDCYENLKIKSKNESEQLWIYAFPKNVKVTTKLLKMNPPPVARPQPPTRRE